MIALSLNSLNSLISLNSLMTAPLRPLRPLLPLGALARRRNACSLTTNNSLSVILNEVKNLSVSNMFDIRANLEIFRLRSR